MKVVSRWAADEDRFLIENESWMTLDLMAHWLGRSPRAVKDRISFIFGERLIGSGAKGGKRIRRYPEGRVMGVAA